MIMYDNSMYMEAGSYNLVIRDPRIPRKRYVAIFKVQFHPSIHRHADEKEKKKKRRNIDESAVSFPFHRIGNIKRAGSKVWNTGWPVLRAGHDAAIVKYDFDSSRRIMELFRAL